MLIPIIVHGSVYLGPGEIDVRGPPLILHTIVERAFVDNLRLGTNSGGLISLKAHAATQKPGFGSWDRGHLCRGDGDGTVRPSRRSYELHPLYRVPQLSLSYMPSHPQNRPPTFYELWRSVRVVEASGSHVWSCVSCEIQLTRLLGFVRTMACHTPTCCAAPTFICSGLQQGSFMYYLGDLTRRLTAGWTHSLHNQTTY